ncbi:hypothetical protein MCGE09_00420 [Thaumarchaeota archaeon SCGC AB-539-E09]|nr:hypothetical protein MCGE09_00420 [Thaumarchaeota archaeon SCGC AB-539-E09]
MKRFMMSVPDEMHKELEIEMKSRRLDSVQETVRQIISTYLQEKNGSRAKTIPL